MRFAPARPQGRGHAPARPSAPPVPPTPGGDALDPPPTAGAPTIPQRRPMCCQQRQRQVPVRCHLGQARTGQRAECGLGPPQHAPARAPGQRAIACRRALQSTRQAPRQSEHRQAASRCQQHPGRPGSGVTIPSATGPAPTSTTRQRVRPRRADAAVARARATPAQAPRAAPPSRHAVRARTSANVPGSPITAGVVTRNAGRSHCGNWASQRRRVSAGPGAPGAGTGDDEHQQHRGPGQARISAGGGRGPSMAEFLT